MIIRLTPYQIPKLWEAIKFAATASRVIDERDLQPTLVRLLADLLSDKAQCFVRLSEDRRLRTIQITKLTEDVVTGQRILYLAFTYAFEKTPEEAWTEGIELIKEYARKQGCVAIGTMSYNKRVWEICESLGFRENIRGFRLDLIGGN